MFCDFSVKSSQHYLPTSTYKNGVELEMYVHVCVCMCVRTCVYVCSGYPSFLLCRYSHITLSHYVAAL